RAEPGAGSVIGGRGPGERTGVVLAIGSEGDDLGRRGKRAGTVVGDVLKIGGEIDSLGRRAIGPVGARGAVAAGGAVLHLHDRGLVADVVRRGRRRRDDHARRPRRKLPRLKINGVLGCRGDRAARGGAQRHAAEITSGGVVGDRGPAQGAGIVLAIGGEGDHLARRRQRAGAVVGELLAIGGEVERLRRGAGGAGGAVLAIRPVDAVLGNDDRDEVAQIVRGAARRRDD